MTTITRIATTKVNGRPVAAHVPMGSAGTGRHDTHNLGSITGYVVRRTIAAGEMLAEPCDVAVIAGATEYGAALDYARGYRTAGSWAVVDFLYTCGCRS